MGGSIWASDPTTDPDKLDHQIEVVGYGLTDKKETYWLVRNSWGTFWGENGFFRILAGQNYLGIELQCSSADVDPVAKIVSSESKKPKL